MRRSFAGFGAIALLIFLSAGASSGDIKLKEPDTYKMKVKGVGADPYTNSPVVILEDLEGKFALPIWIGPSEAQAILIEIEQVVTPRPMTHDLLRNIIKGVKAELTRVIINDLRDNTFYAIISLSLNKMDIPIDSRPSDAIALALRFKAPIFVSKTVVDKARVLNLAKEPPGKRLKTSLGLDLQDMTPEIAEHFSLAKGEGGVLVANVVSGSKAELSGLKRGDIILSVEGDRVKNLSELGELFDRSQKEKSLKLVVMRERNSLTIELRP